LLYLPNTEQFCSYILNRGWIDRSEGHVPTYTEVTSEAKERSRKKGKSKAEPHDDAGSDDNEDQNENADDDDGMLSDTSFESVASFFEASYNHRFEEPGAATIPSFPRNLPATVRREDTTRKDARERKKQRKEEELQKKREEVKRMKALKMREVKRKLELIGKQGGLKNAGGDGEDDTFVDEALRELDLEGEWDPEKHDRQMAGLFDRGAEAFEDEETYEGVEDEGFEDDDVKFDADGKPIWDDDIDIGDIPMSDDGNDVIHGSSPAKSKKDKKKKKKKKKDEDEDDVGVDIDTMDADIKPTYDEDEEWDGTEEMRKRKFNEYMDEIYGLEFNDLVGIFSTLLGPFLFSYFQIRLVICLRASNIPKFNLKISLSLPLKFSWPLIKSSMNTWAWRNTRLTVENEAIITSLRKKNCMIWKPNSANVLGPPSAMPLREERHQERIIRKARKSRNEKERRNVWKWRRWMAKTAMRLHRIYHLQPQKWLASMKVPRKIKSESASKIKTQALRKSPMPGKMEKQPRRKNERETGRNMTSLKSPRNHDGILPFFCV